MEGDGNIKRWIEGDEGSGGFFGLGVIKGREKGVGIVCRCGRGGGK
ncbi:hypothetical protein [Staphylococcus epidermidis]|nr:hypothetical protein [Staphylococcus epidermidis]